VTIAVGSGTISPPSGTYKRGTVVDLTAAPNAGFRVKKWTGTDNDNLTTKTNKVTMNGDRQVTVVFEQPQTITVPGDYVSIQAAIENAKTNDTIILAPGTYHGAEIIIDKEITLTGSNPDDANFVAATIIDGGGYPTRGVIFGQNAGPQAVLQGVTIFELRIFHFARG